MVGEALLLGNRIPHFHLSMPWLAGEERPKITQWVQSGGTQSLVSSTPVWPTPHLTTTHRCFHCKVPNTTHDAQWEVRLFCSIYLDFFRHNLK